MLVQISQASQTVLGLFLGFGLSEVQRSFVVFFASLSLPSGWAKRTLTIVQTEGDCSHNNTVVTDWTVVLA